MRSYPVADAASATTTMLVPQHLFVPVLSVLTSLLAGAAVWWIFGVAAVRRVSSRKPSRSLSSYAELDSHLRGNPHITHGYRQRYSLHDTLWSVFEHHNESGNIWSHLVPGVVFSILMCVNVWRFAVAAPAEDALHAFLLIVYTVGCMNLCVCSTVFHVLSCVDEELYSMTAKIDYTGIALMILVSFFPMMYNLFYCHAWIGATYTVIITLLVAAAIVVSWSKFFSLPEYNRVRATVFVVLGLFGAVPTPHAATMVGWRLAWPVVWPLCKRSRASPFTRLMVARARAHTRRFDGRAVHFRRRRVRCAGSGALFPWPFQPRLVHIALLLPFICRGRCLDALLEHWQRARMAPHATGLLSQPPL